MTPQDPLEGGLAEPTELEPDQGTLALALPGPAATRADWEKAAAGVLRKAGRLREGDPDDAVWAALTRATLDGVGVSPLGTPDLTDATGDHARPTVAGRPRRPRRAARLRRRAAERRGPRGPRRRGLLAVAARRAGHRPRRRPRRRPPRPRRGRRWTRPPSPWPSPSASSPTWATPRRQPAPTWVLPPTRPTTTWWPSRGWPSTPASSGSWSTPPPSTTGAPPTPRSSAGRSSPPRGSCASSRRAASTSSGPPAWSSSATPRPTTSSRPSPSCGRPGCSGRGSWRSAGQRPADQRQHAVTSRPMMSAYDPWVNMLRTTVAAFAATVGGADAVTVQPFDRPLGRPDAFGRRIARNQMALLIDESHVGRRRPTPPAAPGRSSGSPTTSPSRGLGGSCRPSRRGASLDEAGRRDRRERDEQSRHRAVARSPA